MVKTAKIHGNGRDWLKNYQVWADKEALAEPPYKAIQEYRRVRQRRGKK